MINTGTWLAQPLSISIAKYIAKCLDIIITGYHPDVIVYDRAVDYLFKYECGYGIKAGKPISSYYMEKYSESFIES